MADHREAPALRFGTAFTGVSALAALPLPALFDNADAVPEATSNQYANINITDLYVFQKPGDGQKTIFVMNVNPMPPKLADSFDPGSVYEFCIDTDGDSIANVALRIIFSAYDNGKQQATVRIATGGSAAGMGDGGEALIQDAPVSFASNAQGTTQGEYTFFAGLRSDPFFFDLMGFCNNLRFEGNDYFLTANVFGIVLEVPNTIFGDYHASLAVWARVQYYHHDQWLQAERLGIPLLDILFNAGEEKALFKSSEPAQHRTLFQQKFITLLVKLGRSNLQAQEIVRMLLPDVLHYNPASAQGFFNGRKLTDDVADTILALVTDNAVTTDKVGPHKDYLSVFPYLGQPH